MSHHFTESPLRPALLACRFVAVDGGAVFALEVKYVSACTAVCAAPEALTPSWSAALLEAAYYV